MDNRIKKLQGQIDELEDLENSPAWGARYQVWVDITSRLVRQIFGDRGLSLFKKQQSVVLDDDAYLTEIRGRRELLYRLIDKHGEYDLEHSKKDFSVPNVPVNISHSNFHFGRGDNVQNTNTFFGWKEKDIPLWLKYLVAGVTILGSFGGIYFYDSKNASVVIDSIQKESVITTGDAVNVSSIFDRINSMETSLERENFLENYRDTQVNVDGSFSDIRKVSGVYYVYIYVGKNSVACAFNYDSNTERKLLLLKKGNQVNFQGIFTGNSLDGGPWYIRECVLVD